MKAKKLKKGKFRKKSERPLTESAVSELKDMLNDLAGEQDTVIQNEMKENEDTFISAAGTAETDVPEAQELIPDLSETEVKEPAAEITAPEIQEEASETMTEVLPAVDDEMIDSSDVSESENPEKKASEEIRLVLPGEEEPVTEETEDVVLKHSDGEDVPETITEESEPEEKADIPEVPEDNEEIHVTESADLQDEEPESAEAEEVPAADIPEITEENTEIDAAAEETSEEIRLVLPCEEEDVISEEKAEETEAGIEEDKEDDDISFVTEEPEELIIRPEEGINDHPAENDVIREVEEYAVAAEADDNDDLQLPKPEATAEEPLSATTALYLKVDEFNDNAEPSSVAEPESKTDNTGARHAKWIHHIKEDPESVTGIYYLPQRDCSYCGYTSNNYKKICPQCRSIMDLD